MDSATKETLMEEFRAFLESDFAQAALENAPAVGLTTLLSELAALKNEVRLEARQFKTALDTLQGALRVEQEALQAESARHREETARMRRDTLRPLLIQLLDLRDRMAAGVQAAASYRPGRFKRWRRKREIGLLKALGEGQALTLQRLEQLLSSYDVQSIEAINRGFDPHLMRAAEIERRPELDNGIVTAELRRGFYWGEEVLRIAEVKVNKR